MEQILYGVGEISQILQISTATINRYRKQGLVRSSVILGKRNLYNLAGLDIIKKIYTDKQNRLRGK